MAIKSPKGRLIAEGVATIFRLRSEDNPKTGKKWTYQEIAAELQVSMSTVYNVLKEKTHNKKPRGRR